MAVNFETEGSFVYATICEFVKLWGNGTQASLQLNCHSGQAWVQLMSALGPPTSPHLSRHSHSPHHHHGYHGPHPSQHKKRKGARQRERDRARAALHRVEAEAATASAATVSSTSHQPSPPVPVPATSHDNDSDSESLEEDVEDDSDVVSGSDEEDDSGSYSARHLQQPKLQENDSDRSEGKEEAESPRMLYVLHSRRSGNWNVVGKDYCLDSVCDSVREYNDNDSDNEDAVIAQSVPPCHADPHQAEGYAVPHHSFPPCGQVEAPAPHPLLAGLPLPGGEPRDEVSGWSSAELPAEDQIAAMSYEELRRFAGGEDCKKTIQNE